VTGPDGQPKKVLAVFIKNKIKKRLQTSQVEEAGS